MKTSDGIFNKYKRQFDGNGYWVNEEDFKTAINEARIEAIREVFNSFNAEQFNEIKMRNEYGSEKGIAFQLWVDKKIKINNQF